MNGCNTMPKRPLRTKCFVLRAIVMAKLARKRLAVSENGTRWFVSGRLLSFKM
jgi:hypothetical protein